MSARVMIIISPLNAEKWYTDDTDPPVGGQVATDLHGYELLNFNVTVFCGRT